jgi:hypothetical protein
MIVRDNGVIIAYGRVLTFKLPTFQCHPLVQTIALGGSMKACPNCKIHLSELAHEISDHPDGVYATEDALDYSSHAPSNPFDETDSLSSPSSSDEELYTDALAQQTPTKMSRKAPPPPPPRSAKPSQINQSQS